MASLVVGYDGSDCAKAALDAGVQLSQEMDHGLVIVFGYEPGSPGDEHRAHREAVLKLAQEVTAEGVARAREAGVVATVELLPERPANALIAAAQKHDSRAIIVGNYGESPLRGAILGSTPHKLLHLSERPVLVVPVSE